jgi:L-seryl-tRNA(Ser) seleniumtransferase
MTSISTDEIPPVVINKKLFPLLPKVDECLLILRQNPALHTVPDQTLKNGIRIFIEQLRQRILQGDNISDADLELTVLIPRLVNFIHNKQKIHFRRVINCSGVIIHTNLGRSILPAQTMDTLYVAGARYSNLEFDLETGERGSRYSHVEELLCELTGAEAALVVNNNAAAVLIVLETLAKNKEVIVSRGQLVEIGGSFRIPDIMSRSGATLVEVGATNRTHLHDYQNALTENTALLLRVHCSNYRIIGFTKEVSNEDLVSLGRQYHIPVVEDLGSGCFIDLSRFGLEKEPTVQEVVSSGVEVVTFSGDKLLGGPQAGIIVGRKDIINTIKKNPLNRALRIDKFTLSGLESILRLYRDERTVLENIPTLSMISSPLDIVDKRANRLLRRLRKDLKEKCTCSITDSFSRVGGGAMPEQNLPSRSVVVEPHQLSVSALERNLRTQDIPVIARIEDNRLLLDLRTVADDEVAVLHEALVRIFS